MKKIICLLFLIYCSTGLKAQLDFWGTKKFTEADSLRGGNGPMRSCYDVLRYDLDVRVDIGKRFLEGSNTIRFLVHDDFKTLQLDLFSNMHLDKVEYNGRILKTTRRFNAIFVTFDSTLYKGTVQTITVFYSGNPVVAKRPPWDGGFSWDKDKNGKPFVAVSCQGTGASLWWPCKDYQGDEPVEQIIRVTVPPGLTEVSNGRLKRQTVLPDGWTKFEWYVSYPINNYDVTINIADYAHFSDFYVDPAYRDTLTLDYFVLKENLEKAKKQFTQVKPMMKCYYKYFGEYPFIRDGYKLVEAPYLGMEHQSAIAYGNKYRNGYLGFNMSGTKYKFDYIIIHESAHEWWGNNITTNDIADMWIHEGFGTYAEALYIEGLYGHDAYLQYINSEKSGVRNDDPVTGMYGVNSEGSGDMYPKGALILHTVRTIIDDDKKFFSILKGLQYHFRYQTVDSKDVESYISAESGIDFSGLFSRYLHFADIPKFMYSVEQSGDDVILRYRMDIAKDSDFMMPVLITTSRDHSGFIIAEGITHKLVLKDMNVDDFSVYTNFEYLNTGILEGGDETNFH